ncbi:hypothetical protein [Natronococcus occultus]|uniref:Uncharacterized protein n=1 Tax=Natronococcus occultus SP4 TaxID=694430 RepID=L0K5S2_9EURY|nr:hypothetical protein [Natronococcus occultus]AGB39468.1 hypothetical protein Natoc_3755 [Natronococcus occultus SP4]
MKHPDGRCLRCGGRLFGHVEGGYACHNCNARHLLEPIDGTSSVEDVPGCGLRA